MWAPTLFLAAVNSAAGFNFVTISWPNTLNTPQKGKWFIIFSCLSLRQHISKKFLPCASPSSQAFKEILVLRLLAVFSEIYECLLSIKNVFSFRFFILEGIYHQGNMNLQDLWNYKYLFIKTPRKLSSNDLRIFQRLLFSCSRCDFWMKIWVKP